MSETKCELPSGRITSEQELNLIQDEIIICLNKHQLVICDAKALLEETKERIEQVTLLQIPAE